MREKSLGSEGNIGPAVGQAELSTGQRHASGPEKHGTSGLLKKGRDLRGEHTSEGLEQATLHVGTGRILESAPSKTSIVPIPQVSLEGPWEELEKGLQQG